MTVLVTGGAGYIGSHTVRALRQAGRAVVVLDTLELGHRAAVLDAPLVVGDVDYDDVARVLEKLWGGDETLILISSDLSHYHDYDTARALDGRTCDAIEHCQPDAIGYEQACGRIPVNGLLAVARRKQLQIETLALCNSGDTAGDRSRVVGYGAWAFHEH